MLEKILPRSELIWNYQRTGYLMHLWSKQYFEFLGGVWWESKPTKKESPCRSNGPAAGGRILDYEGFFVWPAINMDLLASNFLYSTIQCFAKECTIWIGNHRYSFSPSQISFLSLSTPHLTHFRIFLLALSIGEPYFLTSDIKECIIGYKWRLFIRT